MEIEAAINIHEKNNIPTPFGLKCPKIKIKRHWNYVDHFVIIEFEDVQITVSKRDLLAAIQSVTVRR